MEWSFSVIKTALVSRFDSKIKKKKRIAAGRSFGYSIVILSLQYGCWCVAVELKADWRLCIWSHDPGYGQLRVTRLLNTCVNVEKEIFIEQLSVALGKFLEISVAASVRLFLEWKIECKYKWMIIWSIRRLFGLFLVFQMEYSNVISAISWMALSAFQEIVS